MEELTLKLQYFGHSMRTADSLEKSLMLGKIEGRKRRGRENDEIARWHHQCTGHELGQTPGNGEELGGRASCSPWGGKELATTE